MIYCNVETKNQSPSSMVPVVEIPETNSTENKSKRDKLSEHVRLLT